MFLVWAAKHKGEGLQEMRRSFKLLSSRTEAAMAVAPLSPILLSSQRNTEEQWRWLGGVNVFGLGAKHRGGGLTVNVEFPQAFETTNRGGDGGCSTVTNLVVFTKKHRGTVVLVRGVNVFGLGQNTEGEGLL